MQDAIKSPVNKRIVPSLLAKLFDPMGFISPFIMYIKILFQDIWRLGLTWDEVLPNELLAKFHNWLTDTYVLQSWKIKRCYFPGNEWKSLRGLELHAFCDASEKGYGACIYLPIPLAYDRYEVCFVLSKGRVAPIKSLTLPRLELLGALLCARLVQFVKSALHMDLPVFCWTVSTIVLSWISKHPSEWKTFVRNRVTEIQTMTSADDWFHCAGKTNPGDLISRDVLTNHFLSAEHWLSGPAWLSNARMGCPQANQTGFYGD